MYSKFGVYSNFIFIADGEDKLIPMNKILGMKSHFLKKIHMKEIEKFSSKNNIEVHEFDTTDLKIPGGTVLNYLVGNSDAFSVI